MSVGYDVGEASFQDISSRAPRSFSPCNE